MTNRKENHDTYLYIVEGLTCETSVKDYLVDRFAYSSRLMRKIKREGEIIVHNKKVNLSYPVRNGDKVLVFLGDEYIDSDPEDIPLDIIHEDKDIMVINKHPGIVTHGTRSHPRGTMANAIAFHWEKTHVNAKIRFVNRLDRDTSGIIIIAKNKYAHQFIQNEMKKNHVEKIYNAIVEGITPKEEDTIDAPIGRLEEDSIVRMVMEDGKNAITHYKVIKRYKEHSLLLIKLETGRTHQIRVHLKSIGHPIIGDSLYNEDSMKLITRQALHARKIAFVHPRLQETQVYEAKLPEDLLSVLEKLENESP